MGIQSQTGDLLKQPDVDAIVNTVNCVGVMGKGIALQFKNKWPANFSAYASACKAGRVRLGTMFIYDAGAFVTPHFIINFPTKDHWRGKSTLDFIHDGLVDLVAQIQRLNIKSIAIPPLGCGNGGLDWDVVRPMIVDAFKVLPDVTVYLFEPTGAPSPKTMIVNTHKPRMTLARAAIVAALDAYHHAGNGLGKIELQKLVYFMQLASVPFNTITFVKHQFGPYSDTLRHALEGMEGHYLCGLGDGVAEAEIEATPEALAEAKSFLQFATDGNAVTAAVERVSRLIDGFESSYGMELLATVHWVATQSPHAKNTAEASQAIAAWNSRKAALMKPAHIESAWQRLVEQSWIKPPQAQYG